MASNTTPQDQRKRTMEALERRFAAAEAEHLQQQQQHLKKSKKNSTEDGKEIVHTNSSPFASLLKPSGASVTSPFTTPSSRDAEESGPAYSQLMQPLHENLLTAAKFSSRRGSIVDRLLHELLQNGDSAQKYMQGSKSAKIDNWILLDNYVQGRGVSTGSQLRALKNISKRPKNHMSLRQLKKYGALNLPQDFQKFDMYKPMHEIWKTYMMQLLKTTGKNQLAQCLLSADLHGAVILVAESKITALNGECGIMIRETAETFGIITKDDKFRVVPKKGSVFLLQVDCWKITLQGDKLTSRNFSL